MNEAMKLALEALEIGRDCAANEAALYHEAMRGYRPARHAQMDADVAKIDAAITALRAAISEAESAQPVGRAELDAWIKWGDDLMADIKGAESMWAFKAGQWWADRPWRAQGKGESDVA